MLEVETGTEHKPGSLHTCTTFIFMAAQVGDRVKVLSGQHAGEGGMLLHIMPNDMCIIISDTSKEQLSVFARWVCGLGCVG